jgi:hypothetical protein
MDGLKKLWPLALLLLVGCSSDAERYMPMDKDSHWTYTVQLGFRRTVADVKTAGHVPVGTQEGWRLQGDQGSASLAWKGSTLIATELAGAQYDPPLPLLDVNLRKGGTINWKGTVVAGGKTQDGEATITQEKDKRRVSGTEFSCLLVRHELKTGGRTLELLTWFTPNRGILRQEQRLDGQLTHSLEWLSGP